jgi:transposase
MLEDWLTTDTHRPRRERRTAQRLYEGLQREGYAGAYDSVPRFVKHWKADKRPSLRQAFVPLSFLPGAKYQFDWSHEVVVLGGVAQTVKAAQFRLCYSRRMFVMAFPRETQEMVFEAHNRAFVGWGGVPLAGIYDHPKPIVTTIFAGKERAFNRRFLALMNHYLIEPIACTPAAGWEKGQVENQVGNVREWLFTPRLAFADFTELNAWLEQRCQELAQRFHPEHSDRRIAEVFEEERPLLRPFTAVFDGYFEPTVRVSSTCLVAYDRNRYSVPAEYAGKTVSLRAYADRLRVVAEDRLVAEHPRCFGRGRFIFDPWHYLPVLERKPGALRDGAPFQHWDLPVPVRQVLELLLKQKGGDKAFVELLLLTRPHGLEPLAVACDLALELGLATPVVILNHLHRLIAPLPPARMETPNRLRLDQEPRADCDRYDQLRQRQASHAG